MHSAGLRSAEQEERFRFVVMIVILTLKQKDGMIIQGSIRKLTAFLMK